MKNKTGAMTATVAATATKDVNIEMPHIMI